MKVIKFLILGALLSSQLACKNSLSLKEFCDAFSRSNPKHRTHQVCMKQMSVCTEKELYSPGYTPPCDFARTQACKKACAEFYRQDSVSGVLKLDENKVIPALKSAWESDLKGPGIDIKNLQKPVFTLKEYPNIIFETSRSPSSEASLRNNFEEMRKAAQWLEKLGLNKIVVPATTVLEVPDDKNNNIKLFVATEEYNIPNDAYESYDSYEKIYLEMDKNPVLKKHMLEMFLQLVRLIPKIKGLLSEPAFLFLEKDVEMPQMVIKRLVTGPTGRIPMNYLFSGNRNKMRGPHYTSLAHPDFFDALYEEAQKVSPGFTIANLDKLKAHKTKEFNDNVGHREYALKHKELTADEYKSKYNNILHGLTAPQQKAASLVIREIRSRQNNRKDDELPPFFWRKKSFEAQENCSDFLAVNSVLSNAGITYLIECEEIKDSTGAYTGWNDVFVRW